MDTIIVFFLLAGLAAAYITKILLFDTEKIESHYGPFLDTSRIVRFPDHVRPVTLFDWIRRPFGVYHIQGKVWLVDEKLNRKIDRWTCPYCLTPYIATLMAIPFSHFAKFWILYPIPEAFILFLISVFALSAFATGYIVKVFD